MIINPNLNSPLSVNSVNGRPKVGGKTGAASSKSDETQAGSERTAAVATTLIDAIADAQSAQSTVARLKESILGQPGLALRAQANQASSSMLNLVG